MTIGIYKLTNTVTGKVYVGQSINVEKRFTAHKRGGTSSNVNTPLYRSMKKHGAEAFTCEILLVLPKNSLLDMLEKEWIKHLDSTNPAKGYNLTLGGNLGTSFVAEETKLKQRNAKLGVERTEATKLKIKTGMTGREVSDSFREKMRAIRTGKINSPETREKLSAIAKARPVNTNAIETMRLSNTGRKHSPEFCEKARQSALRREEAKRKEKGNNNVIR